MVNMSSPTAATARIVATAAVALLFAGTAGAQEVVARSERATLLPLSSIGSQFFGTSVATDSNRAVFGAPGLFFSVGAATIFERGSGNAWSFSTTLQGSQAAAGDEFGYSVALDGDLVAVGAPGAGGPLSSTQGAAFVFKRIGTAWIEVARLTASDGAAGDDFGFSVALKGDTLIVGAPGDDINSQADRGSAYVFRNTSGNTWTQEFKLGAADGAAGDQLGWSVATFTSPVHGRRALIGAPGKNANAGAAYMYIRPSGAWEEVGALLGTPAGAARYGQAVALGHAGGVDRAYVGAPFANIGGVAAGAVFAHYRSAGGEVWLGYHTLRQSDREGADAFGSSVAASGDAIVVGAPLDDVRGVADAGSATMFRLYNPIINISPWQEGSRIAAAAGSALANFGTSVAIAGDRVMAGVPSADIVNTDRGAGLFFKLDYQQSSIDDNGRDDIVWFNPSAGSFAGWSMIDAGRSVGDSGVYGSPLGTAYEYCGTGDLYGDGRTCMLYREKSTGVFRARRVSGTAVVSDLPVSGGVASQWRYLAMTDISGDGKADILLRNAVTEQVNAWIMNGHTKTEGGTIALAPGLEFLGAGDLDNDRRSDLVWRDAAGGVSAWMLNGAGAPVSTAAVSGVLPVAQAWKAVSMADLDGDGDRDIVWRNIQTGALSAWRMQGAVREQGIPIDTVALNWRIESAGDLDGDGIDDLVWRNMITGGMSRWRMVDFAKASGASLGTVSFAWSCLSDDDANDDRGWDGNGDDDNGDDSNPDDWNDDHGGSDSDDNTSGGTATVAGAAFVNAINRVDNDSKLGFPILEAEVEVEGGVSYLMVYQWNANAELSGQMVLNIVNTATNAIVSTQYWTPTIDDLERYGDTIPLLGSVTVAPATAVTQALSGYAMSRPHSVELDEEEGLPVWKVEIVLINGSVLEVTRPAN
ncbi:MAG: FG-GAP-like repeat-containing protein [Planctomycetota bacterium]